MSPLLSCVSEGMPSWTVSPTPLLICTVPLELLSDIQEHSDKKKKRSNLESKKVELRVRMSVRVKGRVRVWINAGVGVGVQGLSEGTSRIEGKGKNSIKG